MVPENMIHYELIKRDSGEHSENNQYMQEMKFVGFESQYKASEVMSPDVWRGNNDYKLDINSRNSTESLAINDSASSVSRSKSKS